MQVSLQTIPMYAFIPVVVTITGGVIAEHRSPERELDSLFIILLQ